MNLNQIIFIGFLLRLINAFSNAFIAPSFGADGDALVFHWTALQGATTAYYTDGEDPLARAWNSIPYIAWLIILYKYVWLSAFLPSLINCLAWLVCIICIKKIAIILRSPKRVSVIVLSLFAFLPSSILFTSVPLRESFEIFALVVPTYFLVKVYFENKSIYGGMISMIPFLYIGWLTHSGLIAYTSLFFLLSYLFLSTKQRSEAPILKYGILISVVAIVAAAGFSEYSKTNYTIESNADVVIGEDGEKTADLAEGLGDSVEKYQAALIGKDARSNYAEASEIDGVTGLILNVPKLLVGYMMAPWPWQISSILDVLVLAENWLRLYLFITAVKNFRNKKIDPKVRKLTGFLIMAWLILEFAWAMGTTNWGTAVRHHVVGFHFILIAAYAAGIQTKKRSIHWK
jgi:hypothetical protein